MVKRECFYTSSNPLLAPQVYMATSLLFPRLASSRLLRLRPLSFSASLLCQGHPVPTAPGRRQENKQRLSMKALAYAPKPALYLGFSGLLPFLGAPLLMAVTQSYLPEVAYSQVVYGASIMSFLGGARWGFCLPKGSSAQRDWMNLGNSGALPAGLAGSALQGQYRRGSPGGYHWAGPGPAQQSNSAAWLPRLVENHTYSGGYLLPGCHIDTEGDVPGEEDQDS